MNDRALVVGLILFLLVGACGPAAPPTAVPPPTAGSPLAGRGTELPTPVHASGFPTTAPIATTTPNETPTCPPPAPSTGMPTPAPTPETTAPPSTEATAPPEGLVILHFWAAVEEADPGETIVLEWASTGGNRAVLLPMLWPGHPAQSGWEVALSGTYRYTIPEHHRNSSEIKLLVYDRAGHWVEMLLAIKLRCPDPWFFSPAPEICGTKLIFSRAAEQHFEHGVMIWVEDWWGEEDGIIVLYEEEYGRRWAAHSDEWDEGEPEYDPALIPPAGLLQPVRGFGLLWREHSEVRERLGWAVDQEMSFDTVIQRTTLYKYNSTYVRALDGNVWRLWPELSGWEKIQVTAP